jgi:hypothetical protein
MLSERKEAVAEKRVIVIGATGSGKSTIGCLVLGNNDAFLCSSDGDSCTQAISAESSAELRLTVVDTPGLDDTQGRTSWSLDNIIDEIRRNPPNLICLVFSHGRLDEKTKRALSAFRDCLIGVGESRLIVVHNRVPSRGHDSEKGIEEFQQLLQEELALLDRRRILTFANEPNEDDLLKFQVEIRQKISVSEPAPADYKIFRTWTENLTFYQELLKKWDSEKEVKELALQALRPLELKLSGLEREQEYYSQFIVRKLGNSQVAEDKVMTSFFNQQIKKFQPEIDELKQQLNAARADVSKAYLEAKRAAASWEKKKTAYPCRQVKIRQPVWEYPLCWFCMFKPTDHSRDAQAAKQVVEVQVAQAVEAQKPGEAKKLQQ